MALRRTVLQRFIKRVEQARSFFEPALIVCMRRNDVTPGDLRAVLAPALTHRLLLKSAVQGTYSRDEAAHLLEEILRKVPAPR